MKKKYNYKMYSFAINQQLKNEISEFCKKENITKTNLYKKSISYYLRDISKKDSRKTVYRAGFAMTDDEYELIKEVAKENGLSISNVLQKCIIEYMNYKKE